MLSDLLSGYDAMLRTIKAVVNGPTLKEVHEKKVIKKMMWHRGRKRR